MTIKFNFPKIFLLTALMLLSLAACSAAPYIAVLTATPTLALTQPVLAPTQPELAATPANMISKSGELGLGISLKSTRSPDGRLVAQVQTDTLKWFDAKTFALIGSLKIGENPMGELMFSPNSKLVVSDTLFGGQIIDLASQSVLGDVSGGNGSAGGFTFTKDGKYMAYLKRDRTSGGPYQSIGLWNAARPKEAFAQDDDSLPTLPQGGYYVMSDPAISPDGKLVAAGHSDKRVYIWDIQTGKMLYALEGHAAFVTSVDFSPDGHLLASSSDDGTVRLWNPSTGKLARVIGGFTNDIESVHFSADGNSLQVHLFDSPLQTVDLGSEEINPLAIPPTSTPDPFDIQHYQQGYLAGSSYMTNQVLYSRDGRMLALAGENLLVWDVSSHNLLASLGNLNPSSIYGLDLSPDGSQAALSTDNGDVQVWDIKSGKQTLAARSVFSAGASAVFNTYEFINGVEANGAPGESVAFSPDGTQLAFGNEHGIEIWDVRQAAKVQTLSNSPGSFTTRVSFSDDGKHLYAITNQLQGGQIWDVASGKLLRTVEFSAEDVKAYRKVALNGALFARENTNDKDNDWVEIWNLENGKSQRLESSDRPGPLYFSPDGSLLATISGSQLSSWKTATGQLIYRSEAIFNQDWPVGLAFRPDNQSLAIAGAGKAELWDIGPIARLAQQASIPEQIPAPTATTQVIAWPTATPKPTSTPLPASQAAAAGGAILPAQAAQVKELAHFGTGTIEQANWSSAGDALTVSGSQGVFRYNLQNASGKLTENVRHERSSWTYSVVALPDGRSLAASANAQTGKVQVWDVDSGASLLELDGGGEPALSPDGSLLTYLDKDQNLQVWDLVQRRALASLHSGYETPRRPIFSPDGALIAAVETNDSNLAYNDNARIWDARSGAIVNALGGPDNDITDLSFSADGRFIVGAAGGSAWIWQTKPGAPVDSIKLYDVTVSYNLNLYDHTVTAAGISPDDRLIAVGTSERVIWLYNRQSHAVLCKLEGSSAALQSLRFSPDGKSLLSVDRDGVIQIWDVSTGKALASSAAHTGPISGLVFRQDGNLSAWGAGRAWVIQPVDGKLLQTTQVHGGTILAASPAGDWLAVYDAYRVSLWDARAGTFKQTLEGEAQEASNDYHFEGQIFRGFSGAAFSLDSSQLATGGTGGIWVYDVQKGQLLQQIPGTDTHRLAFSPSGNWLIASMFEQAESPGVIDLQTGKELFAANDGEYSYTHYQFAFSADGRQVGGLWPDPDGVYQLGLWDVASQKLIKKLTFGTEIPVISLAFNPAGSIIALGRADGKILFVNLADDTILASLNAQQAAVDSLAFSVDGRYLASASQDGTVRIWGVP